MQSIKVFLLEDDEIVVEGILKAFKDVDGVKISHRYTIEGALQALSSENNIKQFDLIFLDACIDNENYNTKEIVKLIVDSMYSGPVYTTSREWENRLFMVHDGCTGECYKGKIIEAIMNSLNQKPQKESWT